MAADDLTAARSRELFDYNPDTGGLTWRVRKAIRLRIGDPAGCPDREGYITVKIDKKAYKAHRLIWLHVYGAWPTNSIDHRNGNPSDNRLTNLREATTALNGQNQRAAQKSNKLGLLGVSPLPNGQFEATLYLNRQRVFRKTFDTAEAASAAYQEAKTRLHKFAPTRR